MKENLERLNKLGYDLDDFYCINIMRYTIRLQGDFNNLSFMKYNKLGYKFEVTSIGKNEKCLYFQAIKDSITIVLSLNNYNL
jgi:hypothetical protein